MAMMASFGWILMIGAIGALTSGDSKRLLLNDPDVLNDRMNRLESTVNILNAALKQVISENQQQKQKNEQQTQEILQQKQEIQLLQNKHDSGATYVRWGRKQCPNNNTELVYSGYAGGSYYNSKGAAAEYVCLPPDPNFVKTSGADHGRMYGAEFYGNFFASDGDAQDVPCSLCRSTHSTSAVMIPGKNSCYNGWKLEYQGYLASGYYNDDAATSYVCVDIHPEYIIGGVSRHPGRLFQEVLVKCGSLKCPPYKNNYPLTCVVCSK